MAARERVFRAWHEACKRTAQRRRDERAGRARLTTGQLSEQSHERRTTQAHRRSRRSLAAAAALAATSPPRAQQLEEPGGTASSRPRATPASCSWRRRAALPQKQGLKIEMLQFKGDALALKAMLAGELDSYEGSPGGPMLAASRGADIKIVGCYWPILTYGIFAKPAIASAEGPQGQDLRDLGAGRAARPAGARGAGAERHDRRGREIRRDGQRHRPLQGARRRRRRCRGGLDRVRALCV